MLRHARADDSGQASSLPAVWVQMGAEALAAAMLCQMQVPRLEHAPPTEQAAHPAAMSPADVGEGRVGRRQAGVGNGLARTGRRTVQTGADRLADGLGWDRPVR